MRSSHVAPVTNSSAADDGGSGTFDGDAPLLISASGEVSTNEYACTPAGIWYMLGGLAGAAVEGTLAEAEGPAFVIWLIAPWSLLLLLPSLRGWMPEVRHQVRAITDEFTPIISSAASQHKGTVALGVAASGVAVTLAILSLLATDFVVLGGLIILSTAMLGASFAVLPPAIAKANLFMYFKELFYLQINGSLDYYYTACTG